MCPSDLAPRRTLQELLGSLRDLEATLEANGGEIEPGSVLEASWDALAGELVAKVDHYVGYVGELRARSAAHKAAAAQLISRGRALEASADRLMAYADRCIGPDREALEGDSWKLVRRRNGGREPVEILDEAAVAETCPECMVPQAPKIDKDKLRDALRRGVAVRGARILGRGTRIEAVPR